MTKTTFTTGSTFDVHKERSSGGSDFFFGSKGQSGSDKGHVSFDDRGHIDFVRNPNDGPLGSAGGWNNNNNNG